MSYFGEILYKKKKIKDEKINTDLIKSIFNKISDVNDKFQINSALKNLTSVKERIYFIDLIIERNHELNRIEQFLRFQKVYNLLLKIKKKIMGKIYKIREKNELCRLNKNEEIPQKNVSFKEKEKDDNMFNYLKNPQMMKIVISLYNSMKQKKGDQSPSDRKISIWNTITNKTTLSKCKDFMLKHELFEKKQKPMDILNKIRKEHKVRMENLLKEKKFKEAQISLEHDIYSFILKEKSVSKNNNNVNLFFENETKNKVIRKIEENVKSKLNIFLKNNFKFPKIISQKEKSNKLYNESQNSTFMRKKNNFKEYISTNFTLKQSKSNTSAMNFKNNTIIHEISEFENESLCSAYEIKLSELYNQGSDLKKRVSVSYFNEMDSELRHKFNNLYSKNLKKYDKKRSQIIQTIENKIYYDRFLGS